MPAMSEVDQVLPGQPANRMIWLFIRGIPISFFTEKYGYPEAEVKGTLTEIFKGNIKVDPHPGTCFEGDHWTQREDFCLRRMNEHGLPVKDAARIMGRTVEEVKLRWAQIR